MKRCQKFTARKVGRQSSPSRRYIGRPDIYGNPFVIGRDGPRAEVVRKYAEWIVRQPHLMAKLPDLAGKDLVCWCATLRCHGDVLLDLVQRNVCDKG
ncbi:DUF4326 domain-containing protein [Pararhizobium sp. LjRoot238]|uniref:DUF4326 domain-containing protein n=1 Tax=Pararhizobium sp. LjRoot238 TaxID=3342293 RepID=UPI003ECC24C2